MFSEWAHAIIVEHLISFVDGAVDRRSIIIRNITAVVSVTDVHVFVFAASFVMRPRFRNTPPPKKKTHTQTHKQTQHNVYHYYFHH